MKQATLGGGCFWCLDAAYRLIRGIEDSVCGYAGGNIANPTYEQVSSGDTGHAEVVQLTYDESSISYKDILDIFWAIHNPTTLNRQGNDVGSQYRSVVFYYNDDQKKIAEESMAEVQKLWKDPIVTELLPFGEFYEAEDYHQNYFTKNPDQAYCQVVINPKIKKLQEKFQSQLK